MVLIATSDLSKCILVVVVTIAGFALDTICQNNPIGFFDTSIINADSMTDNMGLWHERLLKKSYSSPGNNVELMYGCSDIIIQTINPLLSECNICRCCVQEIFHLLYRSNILIG